MIECSNKSPVCFYSFRAKIGCLHHNTRNTISSSQYGKYPFPFLTIWGMSSLILHSMGIPFSFRVLLLACIKPIRTRASYRIQVLDVKQLKVEDSTYYCTLLCSVANAVIWPNDCVHSYRPASLQYMGKKIYR